MKAKHDQGQGQGQGFLLEVFQYARTRKRWFVTSVILTLAVIGILLVLAEMGPTLSPFVYTLF